MKECETTLDGVEGIPKYVAMVCIRTDVVVTYRLCDLAYESPLVTASPSPSYPYLF